jgi:Transcription factor WhiB
MRRDGTHVQYRHEHRVRFNESDESWREDAACRGKDTDLWFQSGQATAALACCNRCPVTGECLGMVMRAERDTLADRFGIYGGLWPRQRAALAGKPVPQREGL